MRAPRTLIGTGLAAAAAAVLLTGCASSGGTKSASGTTSASQTTTSSAAPAAGGGGGGAFCDQARAFAAEVATSVGTQPNATTAQNLQQLAAKLNSISPPAEIADDWHTAVTAIQQLGQALATLNPSDASQAAAVEQQVAPIEDKLTTAGEHIDAYLQAKCGINIGGDTASSTS
jgi:ABC-type glycerol-3-phosphate transport system substrate-binding protein